MNRSDDTEPPGILRKTPRRLGSLEENEFARMSNVSEPPYPAQSTAKFWLAAMGSRPNGELSWFHHPPPNRVFSCSKREEGGVGWNEYEMFLLLLFSHYRADLRSIETLRLDLERLTGEDWFPWILKSPVGDPVSKSSLRNCSSFYSTTLFYSTDLFASHVISMARLFFILSTIVASVLARSVRLAPMVEPHNGEIIPGEYIVSLRKPSGNSVHGGSQAMVEEHLNSLFDANLLHGDQVIHKYDLGYAAQLNQKTLGRLRLMPDVDYIEANQVVYTTGVQKFPPSWGLDRIDQRTLPLSGSYSYNRLAGSGVDVCS